MLKNRKICSKSKRLGLQRGKGLATGWYNAKYRAAAGDEIVESCSGWSKNGHVISGRPSYDLLYVSCDLCLIALRCG